jgi:hypothetical protein
MNKLLRLLLLCLCFYSALSVAHEEHNDALLLLIKYKLDIKALQQNYPLQNTDEQKQNLQQQTQLFIKAMDYLTGYVAIPESRYPDTTTYAGSLQSRAALLQDYQLLLAAHLQQMAVLKPALE